MVAHSIRGFVERQRIGEVFHYYTKIGVAALRLSEGPLAIVDTIQVQGPATNLTQVVESMQIEMETVTRAEQGQSVGIKVKEKVHEKDLVYRVLAH